MAKSSVMGGSRRDRLSSAVAGDRPRATTTTVRADSHLTNVGIGTPVTDLGANIKSKKAITDRVPTYAKNIPRSYVPSRIKQIFDPTPFATPVVKMPAAKTKKPVAKPAAQVVSNVTNAKMSPVKNSSVSKKPPATRFGTVTGKTTGTRVSGGGGYGGGGTRGSGSLSGGGSGTRSAGTSRTGGTRSNDPVRG